MLEREISRGGGASSGSPGAASWWPCSGGLDSTALLHLLHAQARRHRLELSVGHVNHGLREAASDADEAAVHALAERAGLAGAQPARRSASPARGRARAARGPRSRRPRARSATRRCARCAAGLGAERIATAHTADDQAETVLLRLLRGSGPDGLGGIPERSPDGVIVRPLLAVSRREIEAFASAQGLVWREDASNAKPDYARNRLRLHWLPGLASEFNPRLLRALGGLAEAQRRDTEWIDAQVEREVTSRLAVDGTWLVIEAKDWTELPEALARRAGASGAASLRRGTRGLACAPDAHARVSAHAAGAASTSSCPAAGSCGASGLGFGWGRSLPPRPGGWTARTRAKLPDDRGIWAARRLTPGTPLPRIGAPLRGCG